MIKYRCDLKITFKKVKIMLADFWDYDPNNPANEPDYPEGYCPYCDEIHDLDQFCEQCGCCGIKHQLDNGLCVRCQSINIELIGN